jgi:major membrane immunogen (membrane-anchored lipoprotein)
MRLALLLAAALALTACGEKEQVVVYKQGKYQGKPDNRSWDNEPLPADFRGGSWTKGDRASWEESIKKRQLSQNEYKRIYQ